jgi:lipopolysaccharide biosynthesis glycosyltransferase
MSNALFISSGVEHLKYAFASLNSIRENWPDHPDILFMYTGEPAPPKFLRSFDRLRLVPCARIRSYNFLRLWLWSDTYDYDKILYLDADTLVLSPLDEVFERDEFFIVAQTDTSNPGVVKNDLVIENFSDHVKDMLMEDGIYYVGRPTAANAGMFMLPRRLAGKTAYVNFLRLAEKYGRFVSNKSHSLISLWMNKEHIIPSYDFRYNFRLPLYRNNLPRLGYGYGIPKIGESTVDLKAKVIHFSDCKPHDDKTSYDSMGVLAPHFNSLFDKYAKEPYEQQHS